MKKYLSHNGNLLYRGANHFVYRNYTPPTPPILDIVHFMYCANDFDGTKIPNRATNSDIGDYLSCGTITKNGSGSNCYLTNDLNSDNFLYTTLSTNTRDLMKAINNTYTFYVRVKQDYSYSTGGIITWRFNPNQGPGESYCYMIRCEDQKIQIHFMYGVNTNFSLTSDSVYKIEMSGNTCIITDLATGTYETYFDSNDRGMSTIMASFVGGGGEPPLYPSGYEQYLDKFYAIAGVARATTTDEDEVIKTYMLSQGV